jgi:hypothetical protein
MVCGPAVSVEIVSVATPPLSAPLPRVPAVTSVKVTVPVADEDVTIAVRVMLVPTVAL